MPGRKERPEGLAFAHPALLDQRQWGNHIRVSSRPGVTVPRPDYGPAFGIMSRRLVGRSSAAARQRRQEPRGDLAAGAHTPSTVPVLTTVPAGA